MRIALVLLLVWTSLGAIPPYSRAQWSHWSDADRDCQNTRTEVLIEESRIPVTLSADGCRVIAGEWLSVYDGELVTSPAALDVDHVVALSAAHYAGGWRWPRLIKQHYANSLTNPDHLIAVSAGANRQKGAKGPSRWMPTRKSSHCWYVRAWSTLAREWRLQLPAVDRRVIRETLATCATEAKYG